MELLAPSIFFAALGCILLLRAVQHARVLIPTSAKLEDDDFFDLAGELVKEIKAEHAAQSNEEEVINAEYVDLSKEESSPEIELELAIDDNLPTITQTATAQKLGRQRRKRKRIAQSERKWWVQVALTAVILIAALAMIFLRKEDQEAQKWAFGTIGLILGFWLK